MNSNKFKTKESIYQKMRYIPENHHLIRLTIELTNRCNFNCRHCYINKPAADKEQIKIELTLAEITEIALDAKTMGVTKILLTGGEPLLRSDFIDIYKLFWGLGFKIFVLTNAALISDKHIELFQDHPPVELSVSVYGATEKVFETVTQKPGTFQRTMNSINKLLQNNIPVTFKSVALQSNLHEQKQLSETFAPLSRHNYRIGTSLFLRLDQYEEKNVLISKEHINADDFPLIIDLLKKCQKLKPTPAMETEKYPHTSLREEINCNLSQFNANIDSSGILSYCSLFKPFSYSVSLRDQSLITAWQWLSKKSETLQKNVDQFFPEKCLDCEILKYCSICIGRASLKDDWTDAELETFFCKKAKLFAENSNSNFCILNDD
jgi:radical SAM protein with 4Fe4S-binding SPASM domain